MSVTDPMRENPEVMGRSEPRAVEPVQSDVWPDMTGFQRRFEQIQADFIEDPKSAVQNAEHLMEEAIERVMGSLRERMQSLRHENGADGDTEQMRLTMRTYRTFMQSLGGRSHAA